MQYCSDIEHIMAIALKLITTDILLCSFALETVDVAVSCMH